MADAKRQGTFISAAQAGIVLDMIQAYRRVMMLAGRPAAPKCMPPTVGDNRRQGATGLWVQCEGIIDSAPCNSRRRLSFDDLKVPESMAFAEIRHQRRFRCERCGGRKVSLIPDLPDRGGGRGSSQVGYSR